MHFELESALEKDLLRCITSFCDIKENDGSIVGRASLAASQIRGFGYDRGALVYKGIAMGSWGMSGILLSGNNVDLARSLAQPICSADALKSWAQTIYSQMKDKIDPWLSHYFLSLGMPAEQLLVASLANKYVTPEEIRAHLQQDELEEIVLALESPDCPDSMSQANFEHQFGFSEGVIVAITHFSGRERFGLEEWIDSLLPETDEFPRGIQSALQQSILQAWPDATWYTEERAVGTAGVEEIKARCKVFRKKKCC